MLNDVNYSKTLNFRTSANAIFFALKSSALLYFVIIFAAYFVADNAVPQIEYVANTVASSTVSKIENFFSLLFVGSNVDQDQAQELLRRAVHLALIWLILIASITRVTFDAIQQQKDSTARKSQIKRAFKYLKTIKKVKFYIAVFRCLGIILIFNVGIILIFSAVFFASILTYVSFNIAFEIDDSSFLLTVFGVGVILLCIFFYLLFSIRLSMATPITIIQKLNVFKSLHRSWQMTKSIWRKLLGQIVVLSVFIWIIYVLVGLVLLIFFQSELIELFVNLASVNFEPSNLDPDNKKTYDFVSNIAFFCFIFNVVSATLLNTVQFCLMNDVQEMG